MARYRGPPREAPRHTGDLWGRGYEYRFDRFRVLQLGPWVRMTERALPLDVRGSIVSQNDSLMVSNGILTSTLNLSVQGLAADPLLGLYDMRLGGTRFRIWFKEDGSGNITFEEHDGTTSTDRVSTRASSSKHVTAIAWGEDIFFVQIDPQYTGGSGGSGIMLWDASVPVFTNVASDVVQKGEFLAVLDNNLIVADNDPDGVELRWSVDGNPQNFTSPGSGNNPIRGDLGEVQGMGVVSDQCIVITEQGAVSMTPTGTLPAFRFREVAGISGCPVKGAVASTPTTIFWLGHDGLLKFSQGGPEQTVGSEPPRLDVADRIAVRYLRGLDLIFVGGFFVDPVTLEYVGGSPIVSSTDAATTLHPGATYDRLHVIFDSGTNYSFLTYAYLGAVSSNFANTTRFPWIDAGDEFELLYVDVVTSIEDYLVNPAVTVTVFQQGGSKVTVTGINKEDYGPMQRWSTHAVGQLFRVELSAEDELREKLNGVTNIYLVGKYVAEESQERIRV